MKKILVALVGSLALVAAGCTSSASPSPSASASVAPVKLTVGLGYIPGVQFARFLF
jgi:ABC-type nitrate/sulfonate/bicarbonate transport system substrate-binding protein